MECRFLSASDDPTTLLSGHFQVGIVIALGRGAQMIRTVRTAVLIAGVSCAAPSLVGIASAHTSAAAAAGKIAGYTVVEKKFSLPAGGFVRQTAPCPAGKVV